MKFKDNSTNRKLEQISSYSGNSLIICTQFNNRKYTPQQVADQLRFKVTSINALWSRHELAALKVGRNRVITQEQLNAYLARGKSSNVVIDYTKPKVTL